jgi:hydroxyacylglutathione hydrolase
MLDILPIKAFNDNYLWLFREESSKQACIVDPGDAEVVLEYLQAHELELAAIFITHHHGDHTGGIERLLQKYDVPVYGPDSINIPTISKPLREGDVVDLFGEKFHVLEVPGHTMDHIAYYTNAANPVLFCGDTLFAGGCGRVFEGTYPMMHESLQKLAKLSTDTQVFCAHEYTMANLAFAVAVSPNDQALADRVEQEQNRRDQGLATVPTSIEKELETNPFLRCNEEQIKHSAEHQMALNLNAAEEVFGSLRQWKDSF